MVAALYSLRYFSNLFGIEQGNPGLYRSQYQSMAKQSLLLYTLAIITTISVAFINLEQAPIFLTIKLPAALLLADLAFFFWFARVPKKYKGDAYDRQALLRLHAAVWGAVLLGISHSIWALAMFEYSALAMRGLVTAFLSASTLGVAMCMMNLRSAALTIVISMFGPIVVYFMYLGDSSYRVSAINLTMVATVFALVLNRYSQDFVRMIKQQQIVEAKIAEVENLSKSNLALANEDSLTKLSNRRSFLFNLNKLVDEVAQSHSCGLAVGVLDLDGFKQVNDVYGHQVGDQVLVEVGLRLKNIEKDGVKIARLGGDEFGILMEGSLSEEELLEFGTSITDAMRVPFMVDDLIIHLGGTVGFARWGSVDDTGQKIFEKADYALYHAKDNARGNVIVFGKYHAETLRAVSNIDRKMQDADFDIEMSLVFQPIVSLSNSGTVGFEVLARWQSPSLGFVSPDVFIRSAERGGAINRLTATLLGKALIEAKTWPDHLYMSFNLSMHDITSARAILNLISIIEKSGFDPKRITFEVTETAIMSDRKLAKKSLCLLKHLGVKIALDDFGTGHSSLSYVRSLPLDKIKLDRSFINDIEHEEDAGSIVDVMVEMCRSLRVDCIVEGVETQGQVGVLTAMGCEFIQGYYFSKPLNSAATQKYLRAEFGENFTEVAISA